MFLKNSNKNTLTFYTNISVNKMDLGHAKNFTHKIHLKEWIVYRKQFKIP